MAHWLRVDCGCCNGLKWNSGDECGRCNGSGQLWVSSKNRLAQWPGGPLLGSEPGLYEKIRDERRREDEWSDWLRSQELA